MMRHADVTMPTFTNAAWLMNWDACATRAILAAAERAGDPFLYAGLLEATTPHAGDDGQWFAVENTEAFFGALEAALFSGAVGADLLGDLADRLDAFAANTRKALSAETDGT